MTSRPSPLVAALLSSVCSGLGQMHCGRTRRGALLLGLSLLATPLTVVAAAAPASDITLALLIAAAASFAGVALFSVVDAARIARRGAAASPLRPAAAALLALLGLAWPAATAGVLRTRVLAGYRIEASSMLPTLRAGDRVLAARSRAALESVGPGDVVVLQHPDDPAQRLVKRVVAVGGERVELREGLVIVDGAPLPRAALGDGRALELAGGVPYLVLPGGVADAGARAAAVEVPPGAVFVLGDHRDGSVDSRAFGVVPRTALEAVVRYVVWPAPRAFTPPGVPPDVLGRLHAAARGPR